MNLEPSPSPARPVVSGVKIERDAWLSRIFGYDAFKVPFDGGRPSAADLGEAVAAHQLRLLTGASAGARAFYYAKVPTRRVDFVQALAQSGFGVVDVNVTFEYQSPRRARENDALPVTVREILPAEYDAVLDIAGSCFAYSRFRLDPEIPTALAHAIKREWVKSYLTRQRGEKLLVALRHGTPVGFLAVLASSLDSEPCRTIDLIGVDRTHQGSGVGKALVSNLQEEAASAGLLLRVGTQAANLLSLRLYEGLGFRIAETAYVLHCHLKKARCLG
jgi:ribosomal protein S18 acetylase RimI-like enzyme